MGGLRGARRANGDVAGAAEVESVHGYAVPGIDGKCDGISRGAGFHRYRFVVCPRKHHAGVSGNRGMGARLNGAEAAATTGLDVIGGGIQAKDRKEEED